MRTMYYHTTDIIVTLILLLFLACNHNLTAQTNIANGIPEVITFDGIITDAQGEIIPDGEYLIIFSLYDKPSGGEPLWSEIHSKLKVVNGVFSTFLGDENHSESFGSLFDKQLYIGIKLGYDNELSPRIKLLPTPFSMRAKIASDVPDNSITADKIAPLAITDDKIKNIDWSKIQNTPDFNLPPKNKLSDQEAVVELPYYWRRHGNYLETGKEFLGTVNDRNLVIKTDSVTRMIFEPYGKIWMGTAQDSALFEVIGKSTFVDVYVKGKLGVGTDFDNTYTKLQVKATGNLTPFRIDHNNSNIFNIDPEGRVVITSTLTGEDDATDNYPLFIDAVDQGIAIQLDGTTSGDNNFVSFWDDDGATGRIEGQTLGEYFSDPINIAHDVWLAAQIAALAVAMSVEPLEIPDVIKLIAEVAYFEFEVAWSIFTVGVTYESGGADYAEWLEKKNPSDVLSPGDIVGVCGGKISRRTDGAEQIMTVSLSPFVLGNMPPTTEEYKYEKVAFKGQVPVKVLGKVIAGDYIIPSGLEDGIGVAVSPEFMTGEEFTKTIGRAWESSINPDVKFVNVGVGLGLKDVAALITKRIHDNELLRKELISKDVQLNSIEAKIKEMKENLSMIKNVIQQDDHKNNNQQKVTLK